MGNANTVPPDALLLLTSQCPHCPTVLQGLGRTRRIGGWPGDLLHRIAQTGLAGQGIVRNSQAQYMCLFDLDHFSGTGDMV